MQLLILAAGKGSRLAPYTFEKPKCLVEIAGSPILDRLLGLPSVSNFSKVVLAVGYKHECLAKYNVTRVVNPRFASTNMLESLRLCENSIEENSDLIICYGDIVIANSIMQDLQDLVPRGDMAVVVDRRWREYWSARDVDMMKDVESLNIDKNGFIYSIGQKISNLDKVEGQYIGLIKVPKESVKNFFEQINFVRKNVGVDFDKMFVTDFLQMLIVNKWKLVPSLIDGKWFEIDTPSDLELANRMIQRVC